MTENLSLGMRSDTHGEMSDVINIPSTEGGPFTTQFLPLSSPISLPFPLLSLPPSTGSTFGSEISYCNIHRILVY